jgi:predicted nucleic acid-binding protein
LTFVLDASVALAWCLTDEATDYTERILDLLRSSDAVVPLIWPLEIANVLVVSERRRRLTADQTAAFVATLQDLPIRIDLRPPAMDLQLLINLARRHSLSVYDTSYLELSLREQLRLATQDQRLQHAAINLSLFLDSTSAIFLA